MSIETDAGDGSKLMVRMGFDGKCKGGGMDEAWVSTSSTKPTVRVRDGRFSADLKGTERDFGDVKGRTRRVQVEAQRPLHRRRRRHRDRQRHRHDQERPQGHLALQDRQADLRAAHGPRKGAKFPGRAL